MKKNIAICILIVFSVLQSIAQVPEKFNYQGVLRNSTGELIKNTNITVKLILLEGSISGIEKYSEIQNVSTNDYGQFTVRVGEGSVLSGVFLEIDWSEQMFLKTEVANPASGSYTEMGTVQLVSVPYSLYSNKAKVLDNSSLYFTETDTLFAVKDHDGNIVFAVFSDGAKVYVNETAKGKVGGFAVSGRSPTKLGEEFEYLHVTPDSTRIYVNDTSLLKGKVGGFAVSGRSPTKGANKDYLFVTADSTRIYIDETNTKGKVGGFAVSGRSPTKLGETNDYFNISGNSQADTVKNEPRIMWYPVKAALLAGEVHVGTADSVGTNSTSLGYRTIAMGNYSQAMGYKSQSLGLNSTAIGNNAVAIDSNSFAFGNYAQAQEVNSFAFGDSAISNGEDSYAIGAYALASGLGSFAIGSKDRNQHDITYSTLATGQFAFAVGFDAEASGFGSVAIGNSATAIGDYAVAFGRSADANAEYSLALSYGIADGLQSIAMGGGRTTGNFSFAQGSNALASGNSSIVIGNYSEASGEYSLAMGYNARTTGSYSTAIGNHVTAQSYSSFVTGYYNIIEGNSGTPISTDPLFVVGNGTYITPSNALTVLHNGNTGIGTSSPNVKMDINGGIAFRQTTPTALSASVNNYNIGTGSYFRLSSSTAINITGILNGVDGRMIIITNIGSNIITLLSASSSSTTINRFLFSSGNITLSQNQTVTLIYDSITQRWRDISLR